MCSLSNIHQDSNWNAWWLRPEKKGKKYCLFFLPISDHRTTTPWVFSGLKCLPLPSTEEDRARENRLRHVGSRRPWEKKHLLQLLLSYWWWPSTVEAHRTDMEKGGKGKGVLRRRKSPKQKELWGSPLPGSCGAAGLPGRAWWLRQQQKHLLKWLFKLFGQLVR